MNGLNRFFSPQCCGGPVLLLSAISAAFGILFLILAAFELGIVFILVGLFTTALCLYLGGSRCRHSSQKHSFSRCNANLPQS